MSSFPQSSSSVSLASTAVGGPKNEQGWQRSPTEPFAEKSIDQVVLSVSEHIHVLHRSLSVMKRLPGKFLKT